MEALQGLDGVTLCTLILATILALYFAARAVFGKGHG